MSAPFQKVPEKLGYEWLMGPYKQQLCVTVPVVHEKGKCIFLSADGPKHLETNSRARAISKVNSKLTCRTQTLSPFPDVSEFLEKVIRSESLPTDLYICHGGISHGSGRSVLTQGYQLKGVGRTPIAGIHYFYRDICGSEGILEACLETTFSFLLDKLLVSGAFRCDFISILGKKPEKFKLYPEHSDSWTVRCLLGRRGSPIRKTHLDYLAGKSLRDGQDRQVWRDLASRVARESVRTRRNEDARIIERSLLELLERAMLLTVESRLYGLSLSYWGDNYDIYARVFDSAELRCEFPFVDARSKMFRWNPLRSTPLDFFSSFRPGDAKSSIYDFSVYPIQNTLLTIKLVLSGIGYDKKSIDSLVSWKILEKMHKRSTRVIVLRILSWVAPQLSSNQNRVVAEKIVKELSKRLPLCQTKKQAMLKNLRFDLLKIVSDVTGTQVNKKSELGILGMLGFGAIERFRTLLIRDLRKRIIGPLENGKKPSVWSEQELLDLLQTAARGK